VGVILSIFRSECKCSFSGSDLRCKISRAVRRIILCNCDGDEFYLGEFRDEHQKLKNVKEYRKFLA